MILAQHSGDWILADEPYARVAAQPRRVSERRHLSAWHRDLHEGVNQSGQCLIHKIFVDELHVHDIVDLQ